MFDPTKRKTLETLLTALSGAAVLPEGFGFGPSETLKHVLELVAAKEGENRSICSQQEHADSFVHTFTPLALSLHAARFSQIAWRSSFMRIAN